MVIYKRCQYVDYNRTIKNDFQKDTVEMDTIFMNLTCNFTLVFVRWSEFPFVLIYLYHLTVYIPLPSRPHSRSQLRLLILTTAYGCVLIRTGIWCE